MRSGFSRREGLAVAIVYTFVTKYFTESQEAAACQKRRKCARSFGGHRAVLPRAAMAFNTHLDRSERSRPGHLNGDSRCFGDLFYTKRTHCELQEVIHMTASRQDQEEERKRRKERKNKIKHLTAAPMDSCVVPHRSTNRAVLWLTAQIGRDAVLSESYGRRHCVSLPAPFEAVIHEICAVRLMAE